jgi:hypothetical protein
MHTAQIIILLLQSLLLCIKATCTHTHGAVHIWGWLCRHAAKSSRSQAAFMAKAIARPRNPHLCLPGCLCLPACLPAWLPACLLPAAHTAGRSACLQQETQGTDRHRQRHWQDCSSTCAARGPGEEEAAGALARSHAHQTLDMHVCVPQPQQLASRWELDVVHALQYSL